MSDHDPYRDGPPVSRAERTAVIALTAAFALLLTLWAFVTPMFAAPDEAAHFDAAEQIAIGNGWPDPGEMDLLAVTYAEQQQTMTVSAADRQTVAELVAQNPGSHDYPNQMSQHPPTYYAVAALVLKVAGFFHHRWDVGVMVLRLFDVLLVLPMPFLVWSTVRRVTRSPRTAVVGAVALFAVPQLAQIGSAVTNDAPVIVLGGVITWLVARTMTGDHRWRTVVWLALAVAAVCSVKGTGLPTVPFVAVALIVAGHGVLSVRARLVRTAVAGAIVALLGSWWWIRNLVLFQTVQPKGAGDLREVKPWGDQTSADFGVFINTVWDRLSTSFWGQFGALQYSMTPILTDTLTVLSLVVVIGWAFRRSPHRGVAIVMAVLPALTLVIQVQDNFRSYDDTQVIAGVQGRYLFTSLVALVTVAAIAWRNLLSAPADRARFGTVFRWAFAVVGLYGLSVAYRGFYEDSHLQATFHGLGLLANLTPIGQSGIIALLVVTVVVGLWSFLAVRQLVRAGGTSTTAPDRSTIDA
ncbi:DUF2142 domain-containing protein [Curtobacterium sp. ER1/6]|uniref:DUF2142 domain-containing protein n=1 Tax=Curtobacterium sp. ER1/6 TaxID=1891920 RepID=UPI00084FB6A5|nr:DUF2142 domain-containing protein [Curtobacterium sp. ER1/6]OEI68694.1 hypothetical protein Cus16_1800 [Curtobacterium sp. ER1/6]